MKIIQLSTRFAEGGAARIGRTLHECALRNHFESLYFYGYGPGGRASQEALSLSNVIMLGSRYKTALNLISYKTFGSDLFSPTGKYLNRFKEDVADAHVVHIHGAHSFYFNFEELCEILTASSAKIMFTLHDYWLLTGRCAFTHGCAGFKSECRACPTLSNYPSVWIDRANVQVARKRDALKSLGRRVAFISPSSKVADDAKLVYPDIETVIIRNPCDLPCAPVSSVCGQRLTRVILVAADFSDYSKYTKKFLEKAGRLKSIQWVVVGKNSECVATYLSNYEPHGSVGDRNAFTEIMLSCEVFVFTSQKDIYPLVLIEALWLGLEVLATASPAAEEVLSAVDRRPLENDDELLGLLANGPRECLASRSETAKKARVAFSINSFWRSHLAVYETH